MFIHRENALKAHQNISYCSMQRDHFKRNNFNTKSDQNIHQDASNCTFFKKNSGRVACPLAICATEIIISI